MTDKEIYTLLCQKSQNIKMHIDAKTMAEIAERFHVLAEKRPPKKANSYEQVQGIVFGFCPSCEAYCGQIWEYCPSCGQRLKWEEDE